MLDALLFTLGLAAGAFTHEAGHQIGAWVHGEDLHWRGRSAICAAPCKNIQAVALYGLGAQALSSELLLLPEHRGPFTSGWLAWNTLQPLSVVVRHEVDQDSTDLRHFSRGDSRVIGGLFIAHGLSVAWRWHRQDDPLGLAVVPWEEGGAVLAVLRW